MYDSYKGYLDKITTDKETFSETLESCISALRQSWKPRFLWVLDIGKYFWFLGLLNATDTYLLNATNHTTLSLSDNTDYNIIMYMYF